MDKNEIRVKVNGGTLIVGANPDPSYPGVYIEFETEQENTIDIAVVEVKDENDNKDIDIYVYADAYTEDWTNKYTLKNKEIKKALEEE